MSNRELFVGAKVTLDRKSPYWHDDYAANPRGIAGKVSHIVEEDEEDEVCYSVLWTNGWENSYTDGDLKVLGEVVNE